MFRCRCCCNIVTCLLATLLASVIGLIFGALLSFFVLYNLGVVIAVAGILALLLLIQLIRAWCVRKARRDHCE